MWRKKRGRRRAIVRKTGWDEPVFAHEERAKVKSSPRLPAVRNEPASLPPPLPLLCGGEGEGAVGLAVGLAVDVSASAASAASARWRGWCVMEKRYSVLGRSPVTAKRTVAYPSPPVSLPVSPPVSPVSPASLRTTPSARTAWAAASASASLASSSCFLLRRPSVASAGAGAGAAAAAAAVVSMGVQVTRRRVVGEGGAALPGCGEATLETMTTEVLVSAPSQVHCVRVTGGGGGRGGREGGRGAWERGRRRRRRRRRREGRKRRGAITASRRITVSSKIYELDG